MDVELSVTSARAKAKAIEVLNEQGHHALTGSVRLAYPFSILVEDLDDDAAERVTRLVRSIDPGAGLIVPGRHLSPA